MWLEKPDFHNRGSSTRGKDVYLIDCLKRKFDD
jgi:hypothetical protein